jgi:hypothetical protein
MQTDEKAGVPAAVVRSTCAVGPGPVVIPIRSPGKESDMSYGAESARRMAIVRRAVTADHHGARS